jgi:hypothetical protein
MGAPQDEDQAAARPTQPGLFPKTQWSLFNAGTSDETVRRAAIEHLAGHYWKPVWTFIRSRMHGTSEETGDLTQDFFVWVLETNFLTRADRSRGRFRAFVKVALQNYLGMVSRKERALKRGGGALMLPFDDGAVLQIAGSPIDSDPELLLDRQWIADLLGRATERLRDAYQGQGKPIHFELFQEYYLTAAQPMDHREAAEKYGLSTYDVSNYLRSVKQRFRGILQELVADTVSDPDELETELRDLFGSAD